MVKIRKVLFLLSLQKQHLNTPFKYRKSKKKTFGKKLSGGYDYKGPQNLRKSSKAVLKPLTRTRRQQTKQLVSDIFWYDTLCLPSCPLVVK